MSVNVKLGNNTINGVETVKLQDATTAGTYHTFGLQAPVNCSMNYTGRISAFVKRNNVSSGGSYQNTATFTMSWSRTTDADSPILPLFIDENGNSLDTVYVDYSSGTGTSVITGIFALTVNGTALSVSLRASGTNAWTTGGLSISLTFWQDSAKTKKAYIATSYIMYDLGTYVDYQIAGDMATFAFNSYTSSISQNGLYLFGINLSFSSSEHKTLSIELPVSWYEIRPIIQGENSLLNFYLGMERFDVD